MLQLAWLLAVFVCIRQFNHAAKRAIWILVTTLKEKISNGYS